MRSVVYATICPTVLQHYTWTGNFTLNKPANKGDFVKKKQIFDVFFNVIYTYDKKYTKMQCGADMKKKIQAHQKGTRKSVSDIY